MTTTRRVLLDTETTGFSFRNGDRVIEIGLIETLDWMPTGRVLHHYLKCIRESHWGALKVHGLKQADLAGYPKFKDIAEEVRDFIGPSEAWAHSSPFDEEFLNGEMKKAGLRNRYKLRDTIPELRRITGASKLDDVISRLHMDIPDRRYHGALLDTAILAGAMARINRLGAIDISALVAAGLPRPAASPSGLSHENARVAPDNTKPVNGGKRETRAYQSVSPHQAEIAQVLARLQAAFGAYGSLIDVLRDLNRDGLRIRPTVTSEGKFVGIRLRTDKVWMTGGDLGLPGEKLLRHLRYHPDQAHELSRMAMDYARDFGAAPDETNPHIGRASLNSTTLANMKRGLEDQGACSEKKTIPGDHDLLKASDRAARDAARAARITEVNALPPSSDLDFYRGITMGRDRDEFSFMDLDGLHQEIARSGSADRSQEVLLASFIEADQKLLNRWILRGLSAAHAITHHLSYEMRSCPQKFDDHKAAVLQAITQHAGPEVSDMQNTKISYMYRDGGNNKTSGEAIVHGAVTDAQIANFKAKLDDDYGSHPSFIPGQIGLPDLQFSFTSNPTWHDDIDHPWHELLEIAPTDELVTVNIHIDDLIANIESVEWDQQYQPETPSDDLDFAGPM